MTALVTCGHTRAGLCAVRALGRADLAVAVAAPTRPALATWSRYATSTLLVPDAAHEARRFAEAIAEEAEGRHAELILAGTDAALWALSRWRENLPAAARRVLPPHDAVARALDRTALHDLASSLGIPCIDVVRVESQRDIEPAIRRLGLAGVPALVRPLVPWVEREDGTRRVATSIAVESIAELRRLLNTREDLVDGGCIIEPRPEGDWLSYGTVCHDGTPFAEVFQERLRESGDLSGVSTLARTIQPDAQVRALAQKVLRALSWQGAAMVELLRTLDGTLRLVSVVGRLWGSCQLSVHAGVNVPLLCFKLAADEPLPHEIVTAKPGLMWRWLVGDVEVMAKRASRLLARLEGPRVLRGRARGMLELLRFRELFGVENDVLDFDDPLPFLLEVEHEIQDARRARA